jgi:hypothetical protein
MMLEDRALARDSPARKRRAQATNHTEVDNMEDDETVDWNNTTESSTKGTESENLSKSPPRIERQNIAYQCVETYADGEVVRYFEAAAGLMG